MIFFSNEWFYGPNLKYTALKSGRFRRMVNMGQSICSTGSKMSKGVIRGKSHLCSNKYYIQIWALRTEEFSWLMYTSV